MKRVLLLNRFLLLFRSFVHLQILQLIWYLAYRKSTSDHFILFAENNWSLHSSSVVATYANLTDSLYFDAFWKIK